MRFGRRGGLCSWEAIRDIEPLSVHLAVEPHNPEVADHCRLKRLLGKGEIPHHRVDCHQSYSTMNSFTRLAVLPFVALFWVVSAQQGVRQLAKKAFPENANRSTNASRGETTGRVIGTDFAWWGISDTAVSFAILNQTGHPVKDVRFLILFSAGDKKHGYRAVDYVEGSTCNNVAILPNLPNRQHEFLGTKEPFERCGKLFTRKKYPRAEIRVLDFKFAD